MPHLALVKLIEPVSPLATLLSENSKWPRKKFARVGIIRLKVTPRTTAQVNSSACRQHGAAATRLLSTKLHASSWWGKIWADGKRPGHLGDRKRTARAANIEKLAPHDLRRTFCRLCHLAGSELDPIQFLLGHLSIQTTAATVAECGVRHKAIGILHVANVVRSAVSASLVLAMKDAHGCGDLLHDAWLGLFALQCVLGHAMPARAVEGGANASNSANLTELLCAWGRGIDQLTPIVYQELRRVAKHYLRRERTGHTRHPSDSSTNGTTGLCNTTYNPFLSHSPDFAWHPQC
jgi:hypothetical protein